MSASPNPLAAACLLLFLCAAGALADPPRPSGALLREPGAIYLEDFVKKPLKVPLLEDAPVFFQPDRERSLGVMRKGQVVEIQAVTDGLYRVRGFAQQGQVAGWIDPRAMTPLQAEFLTGLRQNAARRDEVQALIAKNEVAINMTPEEVSAALGRPSKKSSRLDAAGRQETWEYVRYERVPQQTTGRDIYGRLFTNTIYIKVPNGKLSVVFANNLVSALEQTDGSFDKDARVKVVAAPPLGAL